MAGTEDDLSTVIALAIRGANNLGEFHSLEEKGARPYGSGVKNDAKTIEIEAERGGGEEVGRNDHFTGERIGEAGLCCHQEAQRVEANEAEKRCASGPPVCRILAHHQTHMWRRDHDLEASSFTASFAEFQNGCAVPNAVGYPYRHLLRLHFRSLRGEYLPAMAVWEITKWQGDVTRMHKWVFGRFGWRAIDLRTPYGLVRRTLTILSKAPSYRVATFEESETTLHTWFPLPRNPPPDA